MQKTAYEMRISDWSSDVCSSDLHPLAVWVELQIGLEDRQHLTRRQPITVEEAAKRLSEETGREQARCRSQLQAMLIMMSRPGDERGGTGERAFLAFKLHRFISGAGHVYADRKSVV